MKILHLARHYFPHGTFGYLTDNKGYPLAKTVERPWKNNAPGISCVPEGTYDLVPHTSPKFGNCYALDGETQGVTVFGPSQRTYILIHPANTPSELEGCIAPGLDFGVVNNEWAVVNSRRAFTDLMDYLNGEPARLIISEV